MPLVGALILHIVAGPLFDYVRTKKKYSTTTVRKVFHVAGNQNYTTRNYYYFKIGAYIILVVHMKKLC